ncbi:uncharacterized protein PAC_05448 [Phialocephala subalpina]|uniref:Enoyl reductase (ER) domain-containing protein n=1 Tax=Phialocephala subalpina TaxID=576137 RepID=A0A1L7WS09_9HELO|nr:uncharacterized protein PAC_05448 [Phialocephala subalpina]
MRAAILTRQGDPSVLRMQDDYPVPKVGPGHEVLIRVKAIAISSADIMTRQGFTAGPVIIPPKIIGSECVGIIEAVSTDLERQDDQATETRTGPDGAKYKEGDVVVALMAGMGRAFDGCYSEFVALPPACLSAPLSMIDASSLSLVANGSSPLTWARLASIPGPFLTAYGILTTSLQIHSTDTLLVQGGSSAVGMAVATLAKNIYGLKKIVGTTRKQEKVQKMKEGGYDKVIVLPSEQSSSCGTAGLSEMIKKEGDEPSGFTAIVELVGATNVPVSLSCAELSGGSRVCMAGMLAGAYHFQQPFSPMGIVSVKYLNFTIRSSLRAWLMGGRKPPGVFLTGYSSSFPKHLRPLSSLVKAAIAGQINPKPDKVFKFEKIVKAHEYCESGAVSL